MKFEPLLYVPAYTEKDLSYPLLDLLQRDLHRAITLYNLEKYTAPTYTSAQEGAQSPLHKRKAQSLALSKEEIKLSDPMITNCLGDLKRSQTNFLTKTRSYR